MGELLPRGRMSPWRGWLGDPLAPSFSHGFAMGYMTTPALRAFSRMPPWCPAQDTSNAYLTQEGRRPGRRGGCTPAIERLMSGSFALQGRTRGQ